MKWIKGKGHKFLFFQTQKTTLICLIRYDDNFVIIINDERLVEQYFDRQCPFSITCPLFACYAKTMKEKKETNFFLF
jgi:hypothetical protein